MSTDFSNVINILGQLYINYRDDSDFQDFIEFNDLGLPLAFLASEGLCSISDDGTKYVMESWSLFISSLEIEDTGFETLNDVLEKAYKKK